jgi:hypothetical protein
MLGHVPLEFIHPGAAYIAAKAYTIQEREPWVVMFRLGTIRDYLPCRVTDQLEAERHGWQKLDLETVHMLVKMVRDQDQDLFTELLIEAIQKKESFRVVKLLHDYAGLDLVTSKRLVDNQMDKWCEQLT